MKRTTETPLYLIFLGNAKGCILVTMATLLKIFVGFWIIWIFWYVTGGPLRDDKNKPFVRVNSSGQTEVIGKAEIKK